MTSDDTPVFLPGAVGGALKIGRTVRRPTGPWTPAVHDFMRWLEAEGLGGLPRVEGLDEEGREVLSYVEGRGVPADETVLDSVLVEAVEWLREFHDIAEGYRPDGPVMWRTGEQTLDDEQIICHNDPGTYNWIIQSGHFVAMIDWDLAAPGRRIDDVAFLAWTAVPLYRDIGIAEAARRLDLIVDAYGEFGPMTLLNAVGERMSAAADRIEAGIERGDAGLSNLQAVGEPERTRARVRDYLERKDAILDALG